MNSILDFWVNEKLDEAYTKIANKIVVKKYAKGTLLQQQGDTLIKTFFVKKGVLRSYIIDEKGKEHIYMFATEGWLMSDIVAQTGNTVTDLYIDVLEDAEVECVDLNLLEEIITNSTSNAMKNNVLLYNRIAVLQKRVLMLMSATAQQRYNHFLETYPTLVQRISQKWIASYLGITPEALSKIRNKIAKTK